MLLGEPSPSLAKIGQMDAAALQAKIASLDLEKERLTARMDKLRVLDAPPRDKIKALMALMVRLDALKDAATERLAGNAEGGQSG